MRSISKILLVSCALLALACDDAAKGGDGGDGGGGGAGTHANDAALPAKDGATQDKDAASSGKDAALPNDAAAQLDSATPSDAALDAGDANVDSGESDANIEGDAGEDAGNDAGNDAGSDAGSDAGADAGMDAGDDAAIDAGDDAGSPPCTMIKVKNYAQWCTLSVDNSTSSTAAEQTLCVTPGAIQVKALALAGFQLGAAPWHGTDGDVGAGEAGSRTGTGMNEMSTATVTVGATSKCAWVCCEFNGGGGCNVPNQCP